MKTRENREYGTESISFQRKRIQQTLGYADLVLVIIDAIMIYISCYREYGYILTSVWNPAKGGGGGGEDKIMCTIIFYDVMQSRSTAFLRGIRLVYTFSASSRVSSTKRL